MSSRESLSAMLDALYVSHSFSYKRLSSERFRVALNVPGGTAATVECELKEPGQPISEEDRAHAADVLSARFMGMFA